MAKPRTGWTTRSDAYRRRLIGAGRSGKLTGSPMTEAEVRAYWERGGDLRAARGHGFKSPQTAAPVKARERAAAGLADASDRRALEKWRKSKNYPKWLPKDPADMDNTTAAILSTIGPGPSGWKKVDLEYLPDGRVRMTVTPKRGYAFEVMLPDAQAARDVAQMIAGFNYPGLQFDQRGEGYKGPNARRTNV